MELITRTILNKNLSITVETYKRPTVTFTTIGINTFINRAKTYLVKEKKCKQGQKILLSTEVWPEYLIWFFAAAELGLSFVVANDTTDLSIYEVIDFEIKDTFDAEINSKVFYEYCDTSEQNTTYASESSPLIYTTSSGSTGTPKLITYTHRFLKTLAERNAKLYELADNECCLHVKTLIHSSIVGIYFLPTLINCSNHYYFDVPIEHWANCFKETKIDRCALFHKHIDLIKTASIDNPLTIFAIGPIPSEVPSNITVLSLYGCSETLGPILISKESNNFGCQLDNFYTISIHHGLLQVTMPSGDIIVPGDLFDIENNEYIFRGRSNVYTINNDKINLNDLIDLLERNISIEFDLIVDELYNQIYIRCEKELDLDQLNVIIMQILNNNYIITKQINDLRSTFMNDVKFDATKVRDICREHN